jgi:hypothetical protein
MEEIPLVRNIDEQEQFITGFWYEHIASLEKELVQIREQF